MIAPRLRLGMVGGGQGAFIGGVHRAAARLDDRYELVAGALSSDPERARASAAELRIADDRAYANFAEMIERETARPDPVEVVAIVTPNHLHHEAVAAFLGAGIHVICDKPLCHTLEDALDLQRIARGADALFALTHNYTGYPMARQARAMIAAGDLGDIRIVQVEYAQDGMARAVAANSPRLRAWRADPSRSGEGACVADIGTHAFNLAEFVTGLRVESLAAELTTFAPGARLDDNAQMLLRFSGGARGSMWASQMAVGRQNGLRLRVFGTKAGLEWAQEEPNALSFAPLGEQPRLVRRAGAGVGPDATWASRLPAGHPEGYFEAFAQLYRDFADQIDARKAGRAPDPASLLTPGIEAGVRGMRFIAAAVASSRSDGAWTPIGATEK